MNRNLCLVFFALTCLLLVVLAQRPEYLDRNQGQYGRPNYGAEQSGRPNNGEESHGRPNNGGQQYGRPNIGAEQHGRPNYDEEPYGRPNNDGQQYGRPNSGASYYERLNNDDNPDDDDDNFGSRGNLGRPNYGYTHRPRHREEQVIRPSLDEGFRQDGEQGIRVGGFGQNNDDHNYNTGT